MPETSTRWLPKLQFNLALEQNVLFQKTLIQLNLYCAMRWQDEGQPLPCPRGQHTLSWGVGPIKHDILSRPHPSLEDHSLLPLAQPCHLCQPSPEGPNACLPPAPTQQHLLNWVSNDSIKQAWKEGWPRRAPAYPTGGSCILCRAMEPMLRLQREQVACSPRTNMHIMDLFF